MTPWIEVAALIALVWATVVILVQLIGISAVFRFFSRRPRSSVSSGLGKDAPAITIIRPVKGLEPHLYDCIASTFRQDYPADKISIRLCVENEHDAAYPVLRKLVDDFPDFDVQILLESRDPALHGPGAYLELGPNPKVRNISRAYREAKGDIIWIIDCNVWASKGVLGRMVDRLEGFVDGRGSATPFKFVHQMPFAVDVADFSSAPSTVCQAGSTLKAADASQSSPAQHDSLPTRISRNGGGRLDEMFFATTHVKFYGAINSVGVAPCIVGKSNMFRKSHLDMVTDPTRNPIVKKDNHRRPGVDYFSYNICEDHLIGDLLWRSNIPGYLNHGMVWGDLAVQPLDGVSVAAYAARRVRWLRARKFTVLVATLVEPGVESLLCCAYLAFALTTLPWFQSHLGLPHTWSAMASVWAACVSMWMCVDWFTFRQLHSGQTIELDDKTPPFVRAMPDISMATRRPFGSWLLAWLGREILALPIWTCAVLLGATVNWRGKAFRVRLDASVVEITDQKPAGKGTQTPELERALRTSKDRVD
ncbi:hypothetical protein HIM_06100 [Hirsutella minnesotensis 3608]|uniref:Ceramide glucosyltransferase n=1 Tax=Hirsutella minnesotensis 3608 TaxID=1043627 RepID=A0A0F8A508_9HYPO|nr:hypothetical protein HIM_06100 [Hirsutella minnesotensis 3608]